VSSVRRVPHPAPAPGTSTQHPAPSTQHPFRLIVFDLDGTLVDSRRDLANAVNALLVECGAAALPEERVGRMVGDGAATLVARAFDASGIPQPSDALERFLAIYARHLTDFTQPYDGIVDALAAFEPRATLAVLTNKPIASTRTILDRLDLARFFPPHLVLGGDGPFPRKPEPAGLRWLMERTAVEPWETLMIGDSAIDWRTAHAAGTHICLARYGFGFEGFPTDKLTPGDFSVESPLGLVRL
jgi:phosphoglycolate phosphatase